MGDDTKKWSFLDVVLDSGGTPIQDWYGDLDAAARADFDALLAHLAVTETWSMPDFKQLRNGLSEIRWFSDKTQHRMIGCFGKERRQYVLLVGCTHKQQIYKPPKALETAANRRANYLKAPTRTRKRETP